MKLRDIEVGMQVQVQRGYSIRPAVIREVRSNGTISVQFTDTDSATAKALGPFHRSNYFGATVRPNQINQGEPND